MLCEIRETVLCKQVETATSKFFISDIFEHLSCRACAFVLLVCDAACMPPQSQQLNLRSIAWTKPGV